MLVALLPAALSATNTAVTGRVFDADTAAAGATVTATDAANSVTVTVFSDDSGRYHLPLKRAGRYRLSARFERRSVTGIEIDTNDATTTQDLRLAADADYLARVPSSAWLDLLPDGDMKREFILNCTSCHELDSARLLVDGKPRNREQWDAAFALMRAIDQYALLPPGFDDNAYAAWLTEHLTAERIATLVPPAPPNVDALAGVRITEYPLPLDKELPHDLVVGPDGRIWITAFFADVIWAFDPASGDYQTYALRAAGSEGWGQARALAFDADGTLWVILGGSHQLVALDPDDGSRTTYDVGMYAHSLAIDGTGRIWFNDYFAREERIGMLDPASGKVEHIALPSAKLPEADGLPLPYGLQIDSAGRLYSTQLAANTVALYDTRDGSARLLTMPDDNAGPRRPAIDADDRLWIPEWNTGHLSRYDPATDTFARFPLGSSAIGGYDAEVDPRSGEIWVTGALGASMLLFDPATASALEIPLPRNPAYTRHLAVDPVTGDLWSAYSSLPAAEPRLVRIERRARSAAE